MNVGHHVTTKYVNRDLWGLARLTNFHNIIRPEWGQNTTFVVREGESWRDLKQFFNSLCSFQLCGKTKKSTHLWFLRMT